MIYFNYTYDRCVPCTPWRWAKHIGITSILELVFPIVQESGFDPWTIQSVASRTARSVQDRGLSGRAVTHGPLSVSARGGFWLAVGPASRSVLARMVHKPGLLHMKATYQPPVMLHVITSESDETHVTLQLPALSTNSYSYILIWT